MYYDKPSQEKWTIDLPGGGFIQKPGSQSAPVLNDDFDSPEVNKGTLDLQLQRVLWYFPKWPIHRQHQIPDVLCTHHKVSP